MEEVSIDKTPASAACDGLTASVIVPVYNKERFLNVCVATLDAQDMSHKDFEAVFVDDGSTDGSPALLDSLAKERPWMKVIHQPNGGVCSARNAGIAAACGKYLFYLDPDDEWSPNVLSGVSAFFDAHYDEVDLVTYPIISVREGKRQAIHNRYDVLTNTGVYDLEEGNNYLACQTTMNICVKNEGEKNCTFNFASSNGVIYHEDQQYITEVLLKRLKLGYYSQCYYYWNTNDASVTSTIVKPYYIFDNTLAMFEHLFELTGQDVPFYLQGLFVNDLGWKMRLNAALPDHLRGEEREKAMSRLSTLLGRVEDDMILRHPSLHPYHRYFFLGMKPGEPLRCVADGGRLSIVRRDRVLYSESSVELYVLRTRTTDGGVNLVATLKSPCFAFTEESVRLFAERKVNGSVERSEVLIRPSSWSAIGSRSVCSRLYEVRYAIPFGVACDVRFIAMVGDSEIPVRITYLEPRCNFPAGSDCTYTHAGWRVHADCSGGTISVAPISSAPLLRSQVAQTGRDRKVATARRAVEAALAAKQDRGEQLWIYVDAPGRLDNAWHQFEHDCRINDGVRRYYAYQGERPKLPKGAVHASIIRHGTRRHRLLHLLANKVLCSDVTRACWQPWSDGRRRHYADFDNAELVYLQHGVLWAHMPWYYSYDRVLFDREVVSTQFEVDNLTGRYGFEQDDLIPSGMPRYDFIEYERPAKKKILLCPSWRDYLIGPLTGEGREPLVDKFMASSYYRGIAGLLADERLHRLLRDHGYRMDLKLHPNFQCYRDCFDQGDDVVRVLDGSADEGSYAAIITDYSSYSFDFVYLRRAIVYFIPDEEEFYAGVNNYNELDMDLDDAMGEHARTSEEAVDAIERILQNGGKPLPRYASKEDGFFLHYDDSQRDRVYNALMESSVTR